MDDKIHWREAIVSLFSLHERLRALGSEGLWDPKLPNVAAAEQDLHATETMLGLRLDSRYRVFLQFANGWGGIFQSVDLFGTKDLEGSARMASAKNNLDILDESGVLQKAELDRSLLLPIAVASEDKDLFVLMLNPSRDAGSVVWLAGAMVQKFINFDEFFLALIEYNREEVDDLSGGTH